MADNTINFYGDVSFWDHNIRISTNGAHYSPHFNDKSGEGMEFLCNNQDWFHHQWCYSPHPNLISGDRMELIK